MVEESVAPSAGQAPSAKQVRSAGKAPSAGQARPAGREGHIPRGSLMLAVALYALLMRIAPYLLHVGFGMTIERAYHVYPWNFSPLLAMALFSGSFLASRIAYLFPVCLYLISDVAIAVIQGGEWGFYSAQLFVYAALAAVVWAGQQIPRSWQPGLRLSSLVPMATAGLGGTLLFFLVSNLGVWLTGGGWARPLTPVGLIACYVDALPFFTPTLISMALFVPLLYSPLCLRPATADETAKGTWQPLAE